MPGAVTYQLVSCMNITVECLAHTMIAKIRTNRVFNGKVYSRSKPNSCVNDIKWSMDFSISLPYNDVMCDVMAEPSNGNLFRSELVVQHHDRIVTQSDFGVSVLCRFDLKNRTITNGPLVIDGWVEISFVDYTREISVCVWLLSKGNVSISTTLTNCAFLAHLFSFISLDMDTLREREERKWNLDQWTKGVSVHLWDRRQKRKMCLCYAKHTHTHTSHKMKRERDFFLRLVGDVERSIPYFRI